MEAIEGQAIVDVRNFVLATRDTGYRSTVAAVAELVDNAIQAEATNISIFVNDTIIDSKKQVWLAVLDNGCGMEPSTLRTSLQFGGSDRFNQRSGLGRFGMGLPNSSLSQCRHVEAYSWRRGKAVYRSFLDVDDVSAGTMPLVPAPILSSLPHWAQEQAGESGTLIIWTNCDRLDNRRASTVAGRLRAPLGRRFRYFLWQGTEIRVNGEPISAVDPLFCHPAAPIHGAAEVCAPLEYEMRLPGTATGSSIIYVRFSLLPIDRWSDWSPLEKRRSGISGGAGVSIVRAGREIAYGWYFMGHRRKQNYDDWWRCEVAFEPELDEWFGVTHSKQDINPIQELESILIPDMVAMANRLNSTVREGFIQHRNCIETATTQKASVAEWVLPTLKHPTTPGLPLTDSNLHAHRLQYNISVESRPEPDFVIWRIESGALRLIINENHPFFVKVYHPLAKTGNVDALFHLECILLAYARSEAFLSGEIQETWAAQVRQDWSDTLAALLS